jgi:hypothetical protein
MARTTVGSALVGTGQYNGLLVMLFRDSPECGDVGLCVVEPGMCGLERFEAPGLMPSLFFNVAGRLLGESSMCG